MSRRLCLKLPEGPHLKTTRQLATDANKRNNASELLCAEAEECVLAADLLRTPLKWEFPENLPTLADYHVDSSSTRHTTAFAEQHAHPEAGGRVNGEVTPGYGSRCWLPLASSLGSWCR